MIQGLGRVLKLFNSGINIPQPVLCSDQFKILHISDTPSPIYQTIINMLEKLKPNMIVHTGDIADDIKLGDNPGYIRKYQQAAGPFIQRLVQNTSRLGIVPGNHDNIPFIEGIITPARLMPPGSVITVKGHTLGAAHYMSDLPSGTEYMLYGHNDDMPTEQQNAVFLNGITSINIILLPSGEVFSLNYPDGTNRYRKYRENPPTLI